MEYAKKMLNFPRSGHTYYVLIILVVPANPYPLRLVEGDSHNEGRVRFFFNDQWGSVCNDNWGMNESNVACKSLGFQGAEEFKR